MTIPLELIQILDAIDRNGSFEAAAQEIHRVRSALTYNIRQYEQVTGIQLFDRSQHRAVLTAAGRLLLEQGRQLLSLNNKIEENVQILASGWERVLRIAYDEVLNNVAIFDLIKRFKLHCPHVNLEIFSEILGGCADALEKNKVDIAIGISGRPIVSPTFNFEPLGKIKFAFAVAPHHPLAKFPEPIDSETLQQFTSIFARDSAQRYTNQSTNLSHETNCITFSSMELKRQAQIAGLGIGFLPFSLIKEDIKKGRLVIKTVQRSRPEGLFYLGWNNEKSAKAQQWIIKQILDAKFLKKLVS